MKDLKDITWEDLLQMDQGTIIKDWFNEGVRCIIMRGPSSLCAYVGIPNGHPLSDLEYDDIPLDCHGGLTFSGTGSCWPDECYWYGWDYGHSGDYAFYYDTIKWVSNYDHSDEKKWTAEEVEKDMYWPIYEFKRLMKLSESILNKK